MIIRLAISFKKLIAVFVFSLLILAIGYAVTDFYRVGKIIDDKIGLQGLKEYSIGYDAGGRVEVDVAHFLFSMGEVDKGITENGIVVEDVSFSLSLIGSCAAPNCLSSDLSFSQIPSVLWKTLIAVEDKRFLQHKGVDFVSILRALWVDIKALGFVQGGSTITQQIVKNLILSSEKSISRKVREMIYALYIETQLSKEQIITLYMNESYWGTRGGVRFKGVGAAAIGYFSKPAEKLSEIESIILVSLLKGPGYYNPGRKLTRLRKRVNTLIETLLNNDVLSDDFEYWSDDDWKKFSTKFHNKREQLILKSFAQSVQGSDTYLNLYESMIFNLSAREKMQNILNSYPDADIAVKGVIVDASCEDINCLKSYQFYSKTERNRDKAIRQEKTQIGSTIKPFVYASLMVDKKWDDFISTDKINLKLVSGEWSPRNSFRGNKKIEIREALQKSVNTSLVRLVSEDFDRVESALQVYFPSLKKPLKEFPAQILGSVELSVADLADAYLKLIRHECVNENLDKSVLNVLSDPKKTTISRVVSKKLKAFQFFGKTGTTNDALDNWFVAFDGQSLYVIWTGVEKNRANTKLRLSGASTSYKIFEKYILDRGKLFNQFGCIQ